MSTAARPSHPPIPGRIAQPVHPLATYLEDLHKRHAPCIDGAVATYIPELSKADPRWFGVALATIDGEVYEAGDTSHLFTIQSISKPFVYALALADNGRDPVLAKIGVEPTGDAFNSISLYNDTGRPYNPMINAGAIAATGLIGGGSDDEKMERILAVFSACAGRELAVDEQVYRSEKETGFRNFAIGYMLRNFGILTTDPEPILDLYFRQCSILVNARDLAVMAATLANGGICPLTGKVAVEERHVPQILAVMATCGMYDYAGEWIYRIGMPSKSGVAGGIIGVLPGHMGAAVFSPPLDARGNSVRGIRVFHDLSDDFHLHLFQPTRAGKSVVRLRYDASSVSSKRVRRVAEQKVLAEQGHRIAVYELQGELTLFSVERVIRELLTLPDTVTHLIIDFRRVFGADVPALDLWTTFLEGVRHRYREVILTELAVNPALVEWFRVSISTRPSLSLQAVADTDTALELCEDQVLAECCAETGRPGGVALEAFDICEGLDASRIEVLRGVLERKRYRAGETIFHRGDPATSLFFLTEGNASVTIDLPGGGSRRLTTCTPGMLFGEMAIVEKRPRSATVRADTPVECLVLALDDFERLTATHPDIKVKLVENFARTLSMRVRRLTEEVRALGM
jgi:glutaminase